MKVLIGSASTKKGSSSNQRRKKKLRKTRVKDIRSRPRRKYKKVAVVESNEINNRKVRRGRMGSGQRRRVLRKNTKKDRFANKENRYDPLSKLGNRRLRKFWRFTQRMNEPPENEELLRGSPNSWSIDNVDTNEAHQESECILIEPSCEVIEIDDEDGDFPKVETKLNHSLEDGELLDSYNEGSPKKTDKVNDKKTSPAKLEKPLFYEDLTVGSSSNKSAPLYETIKSNDSLVSVLGTSAADDVIVIDNSPAPVKQKPLNRTNSLDDSVIFVSEHIDLEKANSRGIPLSLPIYIPLSDNNNRPATPKRRKKPDSVLDKVIQPFKKFKDHLGALYSSTSTPKLRRADGLLTLSDQKKAQQYNTNTYNPNKDKDVKKPGKRMVIVDGSNVAFGHSLNKEFSVKGLEICLEYFEKMGHEVKAVVPQFRLMKSKSTDPERLEKLHREGKIVFTPCKNLPGKSATSYDDRFILQLAIEFDAAVVSNDNYRDLLNENPAFKGIIEKRVIGYTWCNDVFILPKDPYGRLGPSLSVILNRA